MKNKFNNKGFTLVELLVVITILSIVMGLGYRVIIGTNKVTKNQREVFSEQQNANLINTYLTKDLEQVRKFTPADTSVNPYTYVLNEDNEKIEYKVQKTEDGKYYSVTRIAGSTSIELISNYPTDSEVPFSISKENSTNNIFKVTLNGKGKNDKLNKYQFDVTSRLENIVAMVGPNLPDTPLIPNDPTKKEYLLNGRLEFNFNKQNNNNKDKVDVIAKAYTKDGLNEKEYKESTKGAINRPNSYTVEAEIPVKQSSHLGISVTNCGWSKATSFGGDWSKLFNSDFVNNAIHIYPGKGIKINSLKIDGEAVKDAEKDGTYYYDLSKISKTIEKVTVTVNINIVDYITEPYIAIGFGNYIPESNIK